MHESKLYPDRQKRVLVDIDETICFYEGKRIYENAIPSKENIAKINKLKEEGWYIIYWTARGGFSQTDLYEFTTSQLDKWGCKYDELITGYSNNPYMEIKPSVDLIIDDKAKRIEEL